MDFVAFDTAGGDSYAVVNLRLFDLKYGRTILIAPQADRSLRSMQVVSPVLASEDAAGYVDRLLRQDDIKAFLTAGGGP